ncbi:MAG: hypothetical protein IJ565_03470 [Bacilli bacterium]|nr:hypothetical protein [Bacilli bacterium]
MSDETKEFLKSKRGRAILRLGIYIIFFIIVAMLFRSGSDILPNDNKEVISKTPLEKFSEMNNYQYVYTYNGDIETIIEGRVYRDIMYFTFEEDDYYIKDNRVYRYEDEEVETALDDIYLMNNHKIVSLIENATIDSKNENYKDNLITTRYSINLDKVLFKADAMYVTLYENDKVIDKVLIEIVNDDITSTITIEYTNIGQTKLSE